MPNWSAPSVSRKIAGRSAKTSDMIRVLHSVGKQHLMDIAAKRGARRRAVMSTRHAVDFRLDLARVRREQQNAVADLDRLRDRMRHEDYGELDVVPQAQKLVLH